MTPNEITKGNRHERQPPQHENEVRNLMDSYSKILDVWKIQNDNYFKRVQVVMGILQVGLFFTIVRLLSPFPQSCADAFLPIFLGILGILSARIWVKFNEKQSQYLEFCRRNLRNLEARLRNLEIPLEYFTAESWVFGPDREKEGPPVLFTGRIETVEFESKNCLRSKKKERNFLKFKWSYETYPDCKDSKGPHSVARVSAGGLVDFEKCLAKGASKIWIVVVVGTLLWLCVQWEDILRVVSSVIHFLYSQRKF